MRREKSPIIWHITTAEAWSAAERQGTYQATSLETEGFIHCSTMDQLLGVANDIYLGQKNLVLLGIDPARVMAEIRFEDCFETGQDFPHIYGEIPLRAVVQVLDFPLGPDGRFELPGDKMVE